MSFFPITNENPLGLVSPSGVIFPERLQFSLEYVKDKLPPFILSQNILAQDRYLAGTTSERWEDLQALWKSPQIKAILITRGGVGSAKYLDKLIELKTLAPKLFIGFSDTTAFQNALYHQLDIPSVSGFALCSDINQTSISEFNLQELKSFLQTGCFPSYQLHSRHEIKKNFTGVLIGGCLSVFLSLAGTPYIPTLKGKILYLEDVGEEPYRIDRFLTQLMQLHDFNQLQAVILGCFHNCRAESSFHGDIEHVLNDFINHSPIPVFTGLPYGHQKDRQLMPIGIIGNINKNKQLSINPFALKKVH